MTDSIKGMLLFALAAVLACTATGVPGKKVLYYANPMDPTVHSDRPAKDSMGMDYVPVYEEAAPSAEEKAKTGLLYYASPMDPEVHSDKPMKDEMGMDYVPVYAEKPGISLTPDQEALIGVQTEAAVRRPMRAVISALGKIAYNERKTSVVSARYSGRVEKLVAGFTGAEVRQGDPLMEIYSPELSNAQQEFLQAAKGGDGWSSGLLESARAKLKLWGVTEDQLRQIKRLGRVLSPLPVLSPLTGTVTRLGVLAGQYVEVGTVLYEVSNLDQVWMEADVYEKDLAAVSLKSEVQLSPVSYPELKYRQPVTLISPVIDPETRTVRVRTEVENPDHKLKPGMFVNVTIEGPEGEPVLAVPESAVLDTGLRRLVYVRTGEGKYLGKTVVLGMHSDGWYAILEGLSEGEQVVTRANFLIDSESQLRGVGK